MALTVIAPEFSRLSNSLRPMSKPRAVTSALSEEEKADTVVEIDPLFTIDPLKFCEMTFIPVASAEAVAGSRGTG